MARNEEKLRKNPRMAMPYKNWDRMAQADKVALRRQAQQFLETLG
jgi:deoxyribodipyrimidine photolyase-related protein